MQTSLLRYPKGDRFIRVHQSLLSACKDNACAAALIAYFEGWHNYKIQQQEYMNDIAIEDSRPIIESSGWQYHTQEQLKRGVLIYKTDSINAAIKLLEELEFISTDAPDGLRLLYKTGRTKWILLRVDKINEYFDSLQPKPQRKLIFPKPPSPPQEKPTSKSADDAEIVFEYRNKRRIAHFASIGKRVQAQKLAWEELSLIMVLLDRGYTIDQLCYAIEGIFANDWYMGNNDRSTVYDSVRHIFKDAATVNKHIAYAEQKGIPFGIKASGAPDKDTKYQAYHFKLAKILQPFVLTDVTERVLMAQLHNFIDRSITLRPPLIIEQLEAKCIEEAGMIILAHQTKIDKAIEILKGIYNEK